MLVVFVSLFTIEYKHLIIFNQPQWLGKFPVFHKWGKKCIIPAYNHTDTVGMMNKKYVHGRFSLFME